MTPSSVNFVDSFSTLKGEKPPDASIQMPSPADSMGKVPRNEADEVPF